MFISVNSVSRRCGKVTARQIEAARIKTPVTETSRQDLDTNLLDKPISKARRSWKGKGGVEAWVAVVKRGRVMYEMDGIPEDVAREALRLAAHKLPVKTRILKRGQ